ncbi:MAG: pitrilysin family protein [Candidatus Pacebacteria bacterium]|nr:pitrilysin family protein [Candidatus Paceibacterota bacterium]
MFQKTIFPNGLTLVKVPQKNSSTVTILILVATGSKYEIKEINGISHLLEHLIFKGTKKRPSQLLISEPLDRVGGSFNAFTSQEYTGYYAKVERSYFDLALDVISDIYLNSLFKEKDIKKEKNVIIEEINMYFDHPSYYVQNLWSELLYKDQPAGRLISGTKESVANISRKDILNYFNTQYTAKNTIIVVAGNFSNIEKKVQRAFSSIKQKKSFVKEKTRDNQKKPEIILSFRKTDQTHLCLGVRAYDIFHPQKYTLEIIASLLGGMMSSRLFLIIREKLGLAYYIKTDFSKDTDTGYVVTQAGVDNSKVKLAIQAILKEYNNIAKKGISLKELQKAKDNLRGSLALGLETSHSQAVFFGLQEIIEKKILTPDQICAKINNVTRKDILKVAKDIFKPSKLNLALVGPYKDEKEFEKILKL